MAKYLVGDILGVPIYVETDLPPTYFYFDYSLARLREKRLEAVAVAARFALAAYSTGDALMALDGLADALGVLDEEKQDGNPTVP